ncbi:transposase [Enterococcus faecium]|nr:transposase [Enterococcus faecium]
MNQLTLDLSTSFSPKENHVAVFIHELVEALQINDPYLFGRPREYDLGAMMKVVLFAYTRETFTSRKIERLAEENLYARWLTQERVPT